MLIKQLAFVLVERFQDEQVDCHATVPSVAGRFAQDHLLKVLALAEVIVDVPDDFLAALQRARTSRVRARWGTYRRLRP